MAKAGVPKTRSSPLALSAQFTNASHDEVSFDSSQSIDEQGTVKVVYFMLHRTGQEVSTLDLLWLPVTVEAFYDDITRSGHSRAESWQA